MGHSEGGGDDGWGIVRVVRVEGVRGGHGECVSVMV